ncbi:hypothetical protein [Neolewinella aurantiaca]|uniref:hypothetical protein n=1 Tax=Neolewinella aurantiaca TaxID=2602767 RepID=UPI001FEAF8BB|nr:hypothetical protein [Neolewinella aurantiaca]
MHYRKVIVLEEDLKGEDQLFLRANLRGGGQPYALSSGNHGRGSGGLIVHGDQAFLEFLLERRLRLRANKYTNAVFLNP